MRYFLSAFLLCNSIFASAGSLMLAGNLMIGDEYLNSSCQFNNFNEFRELHCNDDRVMRIATARMAGNIYPGSIMYFYVAKYELYQNSARGNLISLKSNNNVFSKRLYSGSYASYSNDGILDKPIILVEGYDPSNQITPENYYYGGFSSLVSDGRDLFIVNLNSHEKSINENAALLRQIIQEINGAKSGNHPTAVIGYSMGGIVARKALKNMELAGINHQTSLYVSYDSPHLGANAPLSLQETVDKIINEIDSKSFGYTPSSLKRARNIYNSPAAREMLIAGSAYQGVNSSGFPNNLARVAVTSGSMGGVLQSPSVVLNEQVSDFKFYLVKNSLISWSINSKFVSKHRGGAHYDNVSGGYLMQYDEALSQLREGATTFTTYQHSSDRRITFIPTTSALAISAAPTIPARDTFKYYSPFDKYIVADFSGFPACSIYSSQNALGSNQRHDLFHSNQLAQIKCALDEFHKIGFVIPDRSFKSN